MSKCKNIVITGGNRGIGLGLVALMLKRFKPDHLFATYRDANNAQELLELAKHNPNLHPVILDVRETEKFGALVDHVNKVTNGAGINLLINNSGAVNRAGNADLSDVEKDVLLFHFEVNTVSPILIAKAFLPLLEKASEDAAKQGIAPGISRAIIVNMSSCMGSVAYDVDVTKHLKYGYKISKSGLNIATKIMSAELISKGILAVPIHPGWVKTEMGGGDRAALTVEESAGGILTVLEGLDESKTGQFWNHDGTITPW